MKKSKYSAREKKAFKRGFFTGLSKRFIRRKKVIRKKINNSSSKFNEYEFSVCDPYGHRYNIRTYGKDKSDAIQYAKRKLKSRNDSLGLATTYCGSPEPNCGFTVLSR